MTHCVNLVFIALWPWDTWCSWGTKSMGHVVFIEHYDHGTHSVHGTVWHWMFMWHSDHMTCDISDTHHHGLCCSRTHWTRRMLSSRSWRLTVTPRPWTRGAVVTRTTTMTCGPTVPRSSLPRTHWTRLTNSWTPVKSGWTVVNTGSMWWCNWQCLFGVGSTLASYSHNFGWTNIPIGTHILFRATLSCCTYCGPQLIFLRPILAYTNMLISSYNNVYVFLSTLHLPTSSRVGEKLDTFRFNLCICGLIYAFAVACRTLRMKPFVMLCCRYTL